MNFVAFGVYSIGFHVSFDLIRMDLFFKFSPLLLRNASIELLLQALLSFFPFIKLSIYYSIEVSNYDIVQIQLFFVFSPFSFGSPFVGEVFAWHLCQHESWKSRTWAMYINLKWTMIFFYVHALCTLHSKQPNSSEITSILRWVHLLLLLLACAFSTWHHGLMKLICEYVVYFHEEEDVLIDCGH